MASVYKAVRSISSFESIVITLQVTRGQKIVVCELFACFVRSLWVL